MYITTNDELSDFCERARKSAVLAVDTEFMRERTFYPQLCLVQVSSGDESAAIDPLLVKDLSPLGDLLADESKTKVFHACGQDLEVLYDTFGFVPRPLFDTQVAASFLGHRMQIGYGALVQAYEGVHLAKAEGMTDWSKRPLDAAQLKYAEEDVIYLPRVYEKMIRELVKDDRLSWVEPEMRAIVDESGLRRDPMLAYKHLKRSGSLTRRQLAVAREVCAWREKQASRRNLPRKWVVSDEIVVEICRTAPRNAKRLRRIRGTDNLSERDVELLLAAVRRGLECRPQDCPTIKHRQRLSADAESIIDLMYAMLRLCSEQHGVAIPLIATRDDLVDFAAGDEESPLRHGWRKQIAGERLEALLAGEIGLTIKDGRIETL